MQNLRIVWIISSISFSFIVWLSFMDEQNDIERLFHQQTKSQSEKLQN